MALRVFQVFPNQIIRILNRIKIEKTTLNDYKQFNRRTKLMKNIKLEKTPITIILSLMILFGVFTATSKIYMHSQKTVMT